MRCLYPFTVGFLSDGKTITWSQKNYSKQYPPFQLPCGRCLECRLEYARQWAVRCVHEAKMHKDNTFITLTYSDEHLISSTLDYRHFQLFLKKLRKSIFDSFLAKFGKENWALLDKAQKKEQYEKIAISYFVTGEYGEKTKRPHWHAIIFNYQFPDLIEHRKTPRGDQVWRSDTLDKLWGKNNPAVKPNEIGTVTFESAGYVARYAAKKLVHGDDTEKWEPISKKSSRPAIGKKFLEEYWQDIFNYGINQLANGARTSIPRYYEKWIKKHRPEDWKRYVSDIKLKQIANAEQQTEKDYEEYWETMDKRDWRKDPLITKQQTRKIILDKKFEILQQHLKGDI